MGAAAAESQTDGLTSAFWGSDNGRAGSSGGIPRGFLLQQKIPPRCISGVNITTPPGHSVDTAAIQLLPEVGNGC